MNDKEKARERFVAQDGISHGITQCMDCRNFQEFICVKLAPKDAAIYIKNQNKCLYKDKRV